MWVSYWNHWLVGSQWSPCLPDLQARSGGLGGAVLSTDSPEMVFAHQSTVPAGTTHKRLLGHQGGGYKGWPAPFLHWPWFWRGGPSSHKCYTQSGISVWWGEGQAPGRIWGDNPECPPPPPSQEAVFQSQCHSLSLLFSLLFPLGSEDMRFIATQQLPWTLSGRLMVYWRTGRI